MRVEVVIDGREAIPVRAIPFITGWMMSPDLVAASLANTDLALRLQGVTSHHLSHNGSYAPILPKEWDGIEADLKSLSDRLKADENIGGENYSAWRRESVPLLPAGVLVWKDEFEKAFVCAHSPQSLGWLDERPGDRDLNYSPMIPLELREVVFEGFDIPRESEASVKPIPTDRSYYSEKLAFLNQAAKRFWGNADRNDRDTHPDNATVASWLEKKGFSQTLASKAATIIRPEWAPTGRKPEE
ncbi:MAG: hypothetical protein HZC43_10520 [Nitrosomonadales bacterium]|nr:hypothetical protein [Nitrosomonadales bacterium]